MLKISDYLDPLLVTFLEDANRDTALRSLVDLLHLHGKLHDEKRFYQAIINREHMISTGIGMGVAVPHAKLPGYDSFFIAIGIHPQGLHWDSLDGIAVRMIFMIGGPENRQTEYLQLLSRLTLALKDPELRKKMLQTKEPEKIVALFKGV